LSRFFLFLFFIFAIIEKQDIFFLGFLNKFKMPKIDFRKFFKFLFVFFDYFQLGFFRLAASLAESAGAAAS